MRYEGTGNCAASGPQPPLLFGPKTQTPQSWSVSGDRFEF